MIQIKKTILTLVALLAVTTGAWAADVLNIVVSGTSATIKYDANASNNPYLIEGYWEQSEELWDEGSTITTVTIDGSCKNFRGTSLNGLFSGFSGLTTINGLDNINTVGVQDMESMFEGCSSLTSLDLSSFNTASVTTMSFMFSECSKLTSLDLSSWNTENVEKTNSLFSRCSELTAVDLSGWNTANVSNTSCMFLNCPKLENIYVGDSWSTDAVTNSGLMFKDCTKLLSMNTANPATDKTNAHTGDGGYLKVKPSGTPVALTWSAATPNTASIEAMPAGNVTVSVEYFPQAEFAMSTDATPVALAPAPIPDVPANTDDPIVTPGTVANIGTTDDKQGTLMYFVSQPTDNTIPDAPDYDTDGWSENVPTANGLQQGNAYVWYYIKGAEPANIADRSDANTRNDSDIKPLGTDGFVTLDAEPTYDVTYAEGTQDADKWTVKAGTDGSFQSLPLKGVKAGTKVKLKYDGDRSMLKGVTAVKKAAAPAETTVTLTPGEIGDLFSWDSSSKTINGITIAISGDAQFHGFGMMKVSANDPETGEPIPTTGTFTFTSSVGKIKRIDINHNVGRWREPGAGWPGSYDVYDTSTFTWSGTPAASVTLNASFNNENDCSLYNISSFVFTLEPTN